MKPLALLLILPTILPSAFAQTAAPHARPHTPPPCKAIATEMLSRDLVLPEGCYTVNQYANVGHALTLSPGTTITFGGGAQLSIETNGSLEAIGTAEKPILLRGKDATAGSWGGLSFNSRSAHNRLSYVTVEDAGIKDSDTAAILLGPGSLLAIDHSTVKRSLGTGILVMDNAAFSHFEANHFANTDIPLRLKASDLARLDAASTFTGNTNNVADIPPGEGNLDENVLWHKLAVPYRFESTAEIGAKLTIEAGAQLQFREGTMVNVNGKGSLTAVGTATDPIVFTATDETANYWKGISFNSNSSSNTLRYVDVRFGGSKNPTEGGGVTINHGASSTVQSSAISSCSVGIFVGSEGKLNPDAASSNRFRDVAKNIFIEP